MHSVPVWVLTAVIEISLLCSGALGLVAALLWQNQRRLRKQVIQLQSSLGKYTAGIALHPAVSRAVPHAEPLEPDSTRVAAEASPLVAAAETEALEEEKAAVGISQETLDALFAQAQDALTAADSPITAIRPVTSVMPEEGKAAVGMTHEMLDALLATALEDEPTDTEPEREQRINAAHQSVTHMLSENAVMAQQISGLQEKNGQLRQAIAAIQANMQLPLEKQRELTVPETTMQEMERGLATLQQTRERMLQQLQAHCQLLGFAELTSPAAEMTETTQTTVAGLQEEVSHLQDALEQQSADFQRVQDEYEQLLIEYQRIFAHSEVRR